MKWNTAVATFGLVAQSSALLRFGCSQLTVQRLDPLVNSGSNPSPHLHQYVTSSALCAFLEHTLITS